MAGVRSALATDAEWLWLLDPDVTPAEDALDRLLEQRAALGRSWPLLASKVVLPDGAADEGSLPVPDAADHDLSAAASVERLLTLRVARRGSLLVRRSAIEQVGPPRAEADELSWTARLMRAHPGLLVPASVAVRSGPRARPELGALARLVGGGALEPRETPYFGFALVEAALSAARRAVRGR